MKRSVQFILALLVLLPISGCKEGLYVSSVPAYPVYLSYNVAVEDPHFVTSNIGAYKTFVERRFPDEALGYAGILIFIGMDAQYHAFDLCCPNCVLRSRPLEIDGMFAVCTECTEHYDLSYGYGVPTRSIAKEKLKKYTVTYDGVKIIVR